tara:strand:+ start:1243 stop:1572 length:330 start_codon:yes stop_codon:yes gene_type:complete
MKIFKELNKLGYIHYSATTIEELDDLPLNSAERISEQALVLRWLLKHHNLYGVIIPTETMNWTFKTMTVVEGIVEVPPYKHVDSNDYGTPEEAELACLIKLIEICRELK